MRTLLRIHAAHAPLPTTNTSPDFHLSTAIRIIAGWKTVGWAVHIEY